MVDIDPITAVFGIPLAIFLFFTVGLRVSEARNEAAAPLISKCPTVLWDIVTGGIVGFEITSYIECLTGGLIFIVVPGALGIAALAFVNK